MQARCRVSHHFWSERLHSFVASRLHSLRFLRIREVFRELSVVARRRISVPEPALDAPPEPEDLWTRRGDTCESRQVLFCFVVGAACVGELGKLVQGLRLV